MPKETNGQRKAAEYLKGHTAVDSGRFSRNLVLEDRNRGDSQTGSETLRPSLLRAVLEVAEA
jgi:hypothetical protein